ncbi:hypothetical protein [Bradyrhizobium sp. 145]|uniref:hypothetical protein n=1 Tax=Bradyrhizobium sp. 145 TaxID=2782621 RepID=UPI001FFA0C25|nr:hypothetical protein [Bradyrhizobium sp. 145]MCK1691660.1 hypothetical protein [Bradyrhizobium sp. 145]
MRLAANTFSLQLGDKSFDLKPSLRAAFVLNEKYDGFQNLSRHLAEGSLTAAVDLINATIVDQKTWGKYALAPNSNVVIDLMAAFGDPNHVCNTFILSEDGKTFLEESDTLACDLSLSNLRLSVNLTLDRPPSDHRCYYRHAGRNDVASKSDPVRRSNVIFKHVRHSHDQQNGQNGRKPDNPDGRETRKVVFFHQRRLPRVPSDVEWVAV